MAPAAMIQALGFTHWNSTACSSVIGRPGAAPAAGGAAGAMPQASQSIQAAPTQRSAAISPGAPRSNSAAPSATSTSINGKPIVTPSTCGRLRRRPKFAALAATSALFGPGVADIARAKPAAEANQAAPSIMRRPPASAPLHRDHAGPAMRVVASPVLDAGDGVVELLG